LNQIKEAIQMAGNAIKAIGPNPRTLTVRMNQNEQL
jgi:hypothetical protein